MWHVWNRGILPDREDTKCQRAPRRRCCRSLGRTFHTQQMRLCRQTSRRGTVCTLQTRSHCSQANRFRPGTRDRRQRTERKVPPKKSQAGKGRTLMPRGPVRTSRVHTPCTSHSMLLQTSLKMCLEGKRGSPGMSWQRARAGTCRPGKPGMLRQMGCRQSMRICRGHRRCIQWRTWLQCRGGTFQGHTGCRGQGR